jgi:hypothetical protein
LEDHLNVADHEAVSLVLRQRKITERRYVADRPATIADQMLMALSGVGIVTPRPRVEPDFTDLAERVQLVERVVDGGAAYLGQACDRALKYLIGGEMHMRPLQRLRDHPALRRQTQAAAPQSVQQRRGTYRFNFLRPSQDADDLEIPVSLMMVAESLLD